MRRITYALVGTFALAACAAQPNDPAVSSSRTSAPLYSVSGKTIDGSYVVVLKDGANPRSVAATAGVNPHFVYEAALNGFSAELNPGQLNALQHNPNVDYIEPDQEFHADATVTA